MDFQKIINCACKPGEPLQYCRLRENMCEVEKAHPQIEKLNKGIIDAFKTDDYFNVPELGHEFETEIIAAKDKIMKLMVDKEVKKINPIIKIKYDFLTDDIKSQMKIGEALDLLKEFYGDHEETLMDEILEKAKKLVPFRNGNIIVKKNRLVLRHGVGVGKDSYDKGEPKDSYENVPRMVAFGRLVDVILNETDPSKSKTDISHSLRESHAFWDKSSVSDNKIKSIKFFKNGVLDVEFNNPEDANKIRKVLTLL